MRPLIWRTSNNQEVGMGRSGGLLGWRVGSTWFQREKREFEMDELNIGGILGAEDGRVGDAFTVGATISGRSRIIQEP